MKIQDQTVVIPFADLRPTMIAELLDYLYDETVTSEGFTALMIELEVHHNMAWSFGDGLSSL